MKLTIIVVIVLLGLFDFSMFVMCSHMEDKEQYYHEKHMRGKSDE